MLLLTGATIRDICGYTATYRRIQRTLLLLPILCSALLTQFSAFAANKSEAASADHLEQADIAYQEFADRFFAQYIKAKPQRNFQKITALTEAVLTTAEPIEKVALIRSNRDLLLKNVLQKEFLQLLQVLYDENDTATIKYVTGQLKVKGDPVAKSQNYFLLAKYYEARRNWQGVQAALNSVNARELALSDHHYYQLLMGYSLQNLKQHRKAVKSYTLIPSTSPYFAHAKLNEGTAYLRQGWWTEAHIEFERAIEFLTKHNLDGALRNRLLVVLGYSQLNYEFYRDARNTLRKVAIDSPAANKALMGIGLAAAHQKDFVGASNAFRLLTEKPVSDLSVDEAFLLLPFALEEADNKTEAAQAYQNAIQHFQKKTAHLQALRDSLQAQGHAGTLQQLNGLQSRAEEVLGDLNAIPNYILHNYENLALMEPWAAELKMSPAHGDLLKRYQNLLKEMMTSNIAARQAMLNSYLSQAKFGMAKLYDTP